MHVCNNNVVAPIDYDALTHAIVLHDVAPHDNMQHCSTSPNVHSPTTHYTALILIDYHRNELHADVLHNITNMRTCTPATPTTSRKTHTHPATQPPNHPATQPPSPPASQPPTPTHRRTPKHCIQMSKRPPGQDKEEGAATERKRSCPGGQ